MPHVKTSFVEITVAPEDRNRLSKTYNRNNTPVSDLYFDITNSGELIAHYLDDMDKPRSLKFNLHSYFTYRLTSVQELRYNGGTSKIGFIYDADGNRPLRVVVKFNRHGEYRKAAKLIEEHRIKAQKNFL